mmetsp:Transcript_113196/g.365739  ORF Transcript_113196/g.365739 Transcript_113196/m.365739 type:complete len:206 (+) Transcript_113196:701-1318(+)
MPAGQHTGGLQVPHTQEGPVVLNVLLAEDPVLEALALFPTTLLDGALHPVRAPIAHVVVHLRRGLQRRRLHHDTPGHRRAVGPLLALLRHPTGRPGGRARASADDGWRNTAGDAVARLCHRQACAEARCKPGAEADGDCDVQQSSRAHRGPRLCRTARLGARSTAVCFDRRHRHCCPPAGPVAMGNNEHDTSSKCSTHLARTEMA